jgi:hypothetical protein
MHGVSTCRTRTPQSLHPTRRRGLGASQHRVAVELSPQAVERIATRVVALLGEHGGKEEPELISAGELARRLRVERPWVYRHRQLLGGLRIGVGPKAPWRFDYRTAVEALRRQEAQQHGEGGR